MDFNRSCASATKSRTRSAAGKRPVDTGEEEINIGDILLLRQHLGRIVALAGSGDSVTYDRLNRLYQFARSEIGMVL